MRRVLRYPIPVDDKNHVFSFTGPVLHAGLKRPGDTDVVNIWVLSDDKTDFVHSLRVFGTGQQMPEAFTLHHGSVVAADGLLVWHIFEEIE